MILNQSGSLTRHSIKLSESETTFLYNIIYRLFQLKVSGNSKIDASKQTPQQNMKGNLNTRQSNANNYPNLFLMRRFNFTF